MAGLILRSMSTGVSWAPRRVRGFDRKNYENSEGNLLD